ncbi:MAG: L-histidine N(alpha)-methyltransferase [Planctomycetota bacterium]
MTKRFLEDAVAGLKSTPKRLPSKYFYDERGSALFEQICELDEYYLTRAELTIMRRHVEAMAKALGPRVLLIEPGSGATVKVRMLLRHLREPAGYVPVDISGDHLRRWAHLLRQELPGLFIEPVHADFCQEFDIPAAPAGCRRVVYFPGSTIGNFTPQEAASWLGRMAQVAGADGGLLIGVDRKKDTATLETAYNDGKGVTKAFNRNMLVRLRNELDANVDPDRFEHRAHYNETEGRVEMHLESTEPQTIRLGDTEIRFDAGETIHTENSYKYDVDEFRELVSRSGWRAVCHWTDDEARFSVHYCERAGDGA